MRFSFSKQSRIIEFFKILLYNSFSRLKIFIDRYPFTTARWISKKCHFQNFTGTNDGNSFFLCDLTVLLVPCYGTVLSGSPKSFILVANSPFEIEHRFKKTMCLAFTKINSLPDYFYWKVFELHVIALYEKVLSNTCNDFL